LVFFSRPSCKEGRREKEGGGVAYYQAIDLGGFPFKRVVPEEGKEKKKKKGRRKKTRKRFQSGTQKRGDLGGSLRQGKKKKELPAISSWDGIKKNMADRCLYNMHGKKEKRTTV